MQSRGPFWHTKVSLALSLVVPATNLLTLWRIVLLCGCQACFVGCNRAYGCKGRRASSGIHRAPALLVCRFIGVSTLESSSHVAEMVQFGWIGGRS